MLWSLRRQRKETASIGITSSSDTECPLIRVGQMLDSLQSIHGITLRNMRIERNASLSSTNNVLWDLELGLSLSKESQGRIDGFCYQRLREILGSIMFQYSLRMGYFAMRPNSNESMSCTLRLQSTQRLSST